MLSKKQRINKELFTYVYKKGTYFDSKYFSGRFLINKNFLIPRAAVVVSKKISKMAASRNKIRRQFYESFYILNDSCPKGFCGVFFIKKELMNKKNKFNQIIIDLQQFIEKM